MGPLAGLQEDANGVSMAQVEPAGSTWLGCAGLSGTKIASQNRSDRGGRKRARNHSTAEIAGRFASAAAKKNH